MKKLHIMLTTLATVLFLTTGPTFSEDNPEALVKTVSEAAESAEAPEPKPEERWRNFLSDKGWDSDLAAGGVIYTIGRIVL